MENKELCEKYKKKAKITGFLALGSWLFMIFILINQFSITLVLLWPVYIITSIISFILCLHYDMKYRILDAGLVGEEATEQLLKKLDPMYQVYKNVTLNIEGRHTELDFVIVSHKGIMIVETKNYNGTLIGDENDKELVYEKVARSRKVYRNNVRNPLKQAGREVYLLKEYLKKVGINKYIDYCVYLSNGESAVNSDKIITSERILLDTIQGSGKDHYLSDNDIKLIESCLM